jgi:hypothetical protein
MRTATQREDVCRCRNCIATKRNNDLIELLKDAAEEYADMERHARSEEFARLMVAKKMESEYMKLPVDADGEVIHVGDDLSIYGERRRCTSLVLHSMDEWVVNTLNSVHKGTLSEVHHYHKPTVDEILDELEGMRGTGDYEDVIKRCAELGRTLRELLKEDVNED